MAADLRFDVSALDRASATFVALAAQVERFAAKLDKLDGKKATVTVDADAGNATASLAKANAEVDRLDGRKAKIKVDVDKSLSDAVIQVARLGSALSALAFPAALVAAAPQLVSLAGAAVQMSGALLLIPAAALATGAAIGTLTLGFQNMGTALGPTGTPAQLKKVNEALAAMAPAARAVVGELRALAPAWANLRMDVQANLFAGVSAVIADLATKYLPVLRTTLAGIAGGFNAAALELGKFLAAPASVTMMSGLFANLQVTIRNVASAFAPMVETFLRVAAIGAQFLPGLTAGFATVAVKVRDFVASAGGIAQIKDWIQGGIDAIKSLFSIVGSGGGILTGLFDAAKGAGLDFMGTMVSATSVTDTFLNSGVGQTALVAIFKAINDSVAALLPGLVAVGAALGQGLVALGPSLPALAAAFAAIAISVAPLLADLGMLTAVVLPPLAAVLTTIAPLLGPIAAGLLAMLVVNQVTTAFVAVRGAMLAFAAANMTMAASTAIAAGGLGVLRGGLLLLQTAFLANPIGIVVLALTALVAGLIFAYNHMEGFRNLVDTVFAFILDVAGTVGAWFAGPFVDFFVTAFGIIGAAVGQVGDFFTTAFDVLTGAGAMMIDFFVNLPANIGAALSALGTAIATGAAEAWGWLVTSAGQAVDATLQFFATLPQRLAYELGFLIGTLIQVGADVVQWAIDLPGQIVDGLSQLGAFLANVAIDAGTAFLDAVVTAFNATVAWFVALPGLIVDGLSQLGVFLAGVAIVAGTAFLDAVVGAFNATIDWFVALPGLIVDGLADLGMTMAVAATDAGNSFLDGLINSFVAVAAWAMALPDQIAGFFTDAGTWLLQVGADIIGGLLSGIGDAADAIGAFFTGLIDGFVQGFKDGLGIASPSTVFAEIGTFIIDGLIMGLQAMAGAILAAVQAIGQFLVDAFTAAVDLLTDLWGNFWLGLETVASAVFNAISAFVATTWTAIEQVFDTAIKILVGAWQLMWNTLSTAATTVFTAINTFITITWAAIQQVFNTAIAILVGAWNLMWSTLSSVATTVFNAINAFIGSTWATIQQVFNTAIAFVVGLWNAWWAGLQAVATAVFTAISGFISTVWDGIRGAFSSAVTFVANLWTTFWNGLANVASTVFNGIKGTIDTVIAGIISAFEYVVRGVGEIWNGIKRLLAVPINFMINTVYNDGIVKAWNFVAGLLGIGTISTIAPIPEFREGGRVSGGRNEEQLAKLHGNEHVWTDAEVRGAGGHAAVEKLRANALTPRDTFQKLQSGRLVEGADHEGSGISTSGFGGVKPWVAASGHLIQQMFGVGSIGGVGSRPGPSDHPSGHALDFMTYSDKGLGDRVAGHLLANSAHHAIKYLIWQQRINSGTGWRAMEDRGSITANHFDHVHASYLDNPAAGTDFAGGGGGFINFILDQVRGLYNGVTDPIPGLIAGLVGNPPPRFREIPPAMAANAIKAVGDFLFGKAAAVDAASGADGTGVGNTAIPAGRDGNVTAVRASAAGYGWSSGPQWDALVSLINAESGFNNLAQNPTSTAYGMYQFLNSTWASVGGSKTSDPGGQALYGNRYVAQRYGDPASAWAFHKAHNYYANGGLVTKPTMGVIGESGPELVLPLNRPRRAAELLQAAGLNQRLAQLQQPQGGPLAAAVTQMSTAAVERKLDQLVQLLERRGAGAAVNVYDRSGDPAETARTAVLALRLS